MQVQQIPILGTTIACSDDQPGSCGQFTVPGSGPCLRVGCGYRVTCTQCWPILQALFRKEQQKRFLLKLTERSVTVAVRSQSIVSILVQDRQPVYVDQFSVARDGDTNGNSQMLFCCRITQAASRDHLRIPTPHPSAAEALDGVMHKVLPISPARVPGKQDAGLLCMCGTAVVCTGQTQIQTAWGSSQVGTVVHSGWCYAASLTHHFYGGHIQ